MENKLMNGALFAVPLPDGRFLSGRVMLDVPGNIKRRLLPSSSPLAGLLAGTYLVEMYSTVFDKPEYAPSSILIPGAFVAPTEMGKAWPILGELPVNPSTVEFPEGVSLSNSRPAFFCGEMKIPIPFSESQCGDIHGKKGTNLRGGFDFAGHFRFVCEWALGIPNKYIYSAPEYRDLRFSKHRARVYEHLPFPVEMSYYEKQKMMGLNLDRLYD